MRFLYALIFILVVDFSLASAAPFKPCPPNEYCLPSTVERSDLRGFESGAINVPIDYEYKQQLIKSAALWAKNNAAASAVTKALERMMRNIGWGRGGSSAGSQRDAGTTGQNQEDTRDVSVSSIVRIVSKECIHTAEISACGGNFLSAMTTYDRCSSRKIPISEEFILCLKEKCHRGAAAECFRE